MNYISINLLKKKTTEMTRFYLGRHNKESLGERKLYKSLGSENKGFGFHLGFCHSLAPDSVVTDPQGELMLSQHRVPTGSSVLYCVLCPSPRQKIFLYKAIRDVTAKLKALSAWQGVMGSYCFMGTEFLFCKM